MISICGVVVHARPEVSKDVRFRLESLEGVEVHAETVSGQFVVTVESDDEDDTIATLDQMQRLEGVYSTALAYGHNEYEPDEVGVTS